MKKFLKISLLAVMVVAFVLLTKSIELGYLDMNSIYVKGTIIIFHLGFMIYFYIDVIKGIDIFESIISVILLGVSLILIILRY